MAAGLAAVRLDDDARRMEMADSESGHSFQSTFDKLHDLVVFQLVWNREEKCGDAAGLRHSSAQRNDGEAGHAAAPWRLQVAARSGGC